ncbi:hypothetical protein ACFL5Z_18820 [Planctomycetota bacterium]
MLFIYQQPIADGRSFTSAGQSKLSLPSWPHPWPGAEFVRCFGPVKRRMRGATGLAPWDDELFFSAANGAVKLPHLERALIGKVTPRGAFRRLFCDGRAVVRVEIGVAATQDHALADHEVLKVVESYLQLPTRIVLFRSTGMNKPLFMQGQGLAKSYAAATTGTNSDVHNDIVHPCEPMVLVEYVAAEIRTLPHRSIIIKAADHNLAYTRLHIHNKTIGVWFIERKRPAPALGSFDRLPKNYDATLRRIRLCLFRLHAEHQVLGAILRMVSQGVIKYEPKTRAGDVFEDYLNRTTRHLYQKTFDGVEQGQMRQAMMAYEQFVSVAERNILLQEMQNARRQIVRKIERITQPTKQETKIYVVTVDGDIVNGDKIVNNVNTSINFGDNNVFNGDVIAAGNITDSFNKAESVERDDLQKALKDLTGTVAQLCEQLPDNEDQQQVSRKLKTLVEEASSKKPDKSWLELSGKGLIEAAKTVAAMATPVTTAVKAVLSLLGMVI